ncbi:MAG: hypothetical protein IT462_11595 [Planctomycetes bacterium]|nr:hypothetical protein [Planctomycetota bacterium]
MRYYEKSELTYDGPQLTDFLKQLSTSSDVLDYLIQREEADRGGQFIAIKNDEVGKWYRKLRAKEAQERVGFFLYS